MTAPLQPVPASPVAPDTTATQGAAPEHDRAYWTTVLHNAAQVPQGHPRYAEARAVIQMAKDGLQSAADSASAKDIRDISPGPIGTALVAFGHGASLGLAGDPTYLQLARQANPKTAFTADLAGTAALAGAASPLVAGLSPTVGATVLGGGVSAIRGAVEPIAGLSRAESALATGAVGALTGAVAGRLASKLIPIARSVGGNILQLIGKGATTAEAEGVSEAAVRAELTRLKVRPDILERTVQQWKAEPHPVAVGTTEATAIGSRPGTSVEPVATGKPQRGLTQAQYAYRGGVASGAKSSTPPVAPAGAAQLQQLKTLLQLPNDQFEAAASMFPKSLMDEVRAVRVQYHGPNGPKP